jgi:hypothetical protein
MSNAELTHITIILDRSGSMASVRDDAIGGFNTCVGEQKKLPGSATLTLVQFDGEYDVVHRAVKLEAVPLMTTDTFVPRGQTALYDAIGRAVAETTEYVRGLEEIAFTSSPEGTRGAFSLMSDGISSSRSRRNPGRSGPTKPH